MFPMKLTLTVSTVEELARVQAMVSGTYAAIVADKPTLTGSNDKADTVRQMETAAAPVEKPKAKKPTAAPTPESPASTPAPSSPTAEAVAVAAPEKTVDASTPTAAPVAAPPQASTAVVEAPFEYATLQKLVFKHLPTHGTKLLEVSVKHGAAKFKELPADKWAAAYADLVELYGA